MKRIMSLALLPMAVITLLAASARARAQPTSEVQVVIVTLAPEATVDGTIVTLDQIAKLTGGTEAQRRRLGKLVVIDSPASASSRVVTSDLVRFRLLLADLDASEFRLSGARRTTIVEPDEPVTFRRVLAVADHAVRTRYP